jgi:hypothetical protein
MPALSAKNVLNVEKTTSGEHFWPAALASNSAIGGQVFARPHDDPVIRISSEHAHKKGEVVVPAGGETGGPHCLAEVYKAVKKQHYRLSTNQKN